MLPAPVIPISIHSLRMEGDEIPDSPTTGNVVFQSTPSAWRETKNIGSRWFKLSYFNPLPPHGGRHFSRKWKSQMLYFNPLPPHGGRLFVPREKFIFNAISIHSLRMEGDCPELSHPGQTHYFNPLPPHGGRLLAGRCDSVIKIISIHSLRMEGDVHRYTLIRDTFIFQSTPSAWRETVAGVVTVGVHQNFNPLPPHGGRRKRRWRELPIVTFQSTPSAWRETSGTLTPRTDSLFQSTPSAWRETETKYIIVNVFLEFQSTPSAWRETLIAGA